MKFHVDLEITADEMRKLFGLPDVEALQRQILEDIQSKIDQGLEGYDPLELMQPYFKTSLAGMDMMQRLLAAGFASSGDKPTSSSSG